MFTSTKLIHVDQSAIYNMIYPLAAFENCQLSFDDFKKVCEGEEVSGCTEEDILLAQNLQAACTYMLDTLNEQVSVDYAYRLNEILTRGRISGEVKRDYNVDAEDLEIIKILRSYDYDLSNYDLNKLVPAIQNDTYLNDLMNVSQDEYQQILSDIVTKQDYMYPYNCFAPIIKNQYFKKSNIITGALIVCKIVLRAKTHLVFIEPNHNLDLAVSLLDCIYSETDDPFSHFVSIMEKHRVESINRSSVKVMIHY